MMAYADKTFCTGDGCAAFDDCPRALTPAVEAKAERWWGKPGAPISRFESPKDLTCYIDKPAEDTKE